VSYAPKVTAEFLDDAREKSPEEKAEMLQRLAHALDKAPEDIRGLHFLLGSGYGMDSHGRLKLHHTDNALLWTG
jgi:hypothetical protein